MVVTDNDFTVQLIQEHPNVMKFVKSRAPLIEFLGLGECVSMCVCEGVCLCSYVCACV